MEDHDTFIRSRFWQKQHARGRPWLLYCSKYVRLAAIDPRCRYIQRVSQLQKPWRTMTPLFGRDFDKSNMLKEDHDSSIVRNTFDWQQSIHDVVTFRGLVSSKRHGGPWHLYSVEILTKSTRSRRTMTPLSFEIVWLATIDPRCHYVPRVSQLQTPWRTMTPLFGQDFWQKQHACIII
jgi:hypothetical protein